METFDLRRASDQELGLASQGGVMYHAPGAQFRMKSFQTRLG